MEHFRPPLPNPLPEGEGSYSLSFLLILVFTGIVETTAKVLQKTDTGLVLERPRTFTDITIGSSICVSGACLSVVGLDDQTMRFDVVPETWRRTNLGDLHIGDCVNLERSLRADGRFEGHVVQGHVEGTGLVTCYLPAGQAGSLHDRETILTVQIPKDLLSFVIEKGGIAIDGVSLTVAKMEGDQCTIALIPHTLEVTTLGSLKEGERVNIETDVMGRYMMSIVKTVSS